MFGFIRCQRHFKNAVSLCVIGDHAHGFHQVGPARHLLFRARLFHKPHRLAAINRQDVDAVIMPIQTTAAFDQLSFRDALDIPQLAAIQFSAKFVLNNQWGKGFGFWIIEIKRGANVETSASRAPKEKSV